MSFFDDAKKKLEEAHDWIDTEGGADGVKEKASARADEVLAAAAQMGGKIPGDIDDKLITRAQELKDKIDGKTSSTQK